MKSILTKFIYTFLFISIFWVSAVAQPFVHPGVDQNAKDLASMKALVLKGEQPYKGAFDRLKASADTGFAVKAHTHVLRGPYGRPNIGGDDLSRSASMAYNFALTWYITNDQSYADKAIAILNAWSPVLWHFDYNDAKLLAAWTGHQLCNAAEILKYSNAGWKQADIRQFSNMLMTAYYPLIRNYYPQANGNWDGAIIHSILAIAIFTDNRDMFNNAVDHYLHAPFNGSIFKYIYPNGQCQETMRDQGHVQLGLGEFAGAAQVAYTQGVDLFAEGNNRLALGYEYTASFLLGDKPYSYGVISERAKALRDDYETVYRHYASKGINIPYTKRAADSVRSKASRSILTAVRAGTSDLVKATAKLQASKIGYIPGTWYSDIPTPPLDTIFVSVGSDVQKALDGAAGKGRAVLLKKGIHKLPATLKMPSSVTLTGEGIETVIFLDPASGERDAIVNADNDMHDVTIRNLLVEVSPRTEIASDPNSTRSYRGGYNRGGIIFRSLREGQMKNISLISITVQNATYNGVFISGGSNVNIVTCDFNENGGNAIPGPMLQHNLLLTHCNDVTVKACRLDTSPFGSGIALAHCSDIVVNNCEIARNAYYGVLISESKNISIEQNLIEANDRSGIMVEWLFNGSDNVKASGNIIQYNAGPGIESFAATKSSFTNNKFARNGNSSVQEKISAEKKLLMK